MTRQCLFLASVLIACIAGLPGSLLAQTTYYVRTSGNDLLASGLSPAKAFRTIQRAVSLCNGNSGGFTVVVGPGTYAETVTLTSLSGAGNGTISNHNRIIGDITGSLTGDAPGAVIISGGSTRNYGIQVTSRTYWDFAGLTIRDQKLYGITITGGRGFNISSCAIKPPPGTNVGIHASSTDIVLNSNSFERTGATGHCAYITAASSGYITFRNNRFNMTGQAYHTSFFRANKGWGGQSWNPSNLASGFSTMYPGFTLGLVALSLSPSVATVITIENNVGTDCMAGIGVYATGNSSSSVTVSSNSMTGCLYPFYVYCDANSRGSLVNNIATDSYYPAYGYLVGGRIDGLLQNTIAAALPSTAKSVTGVITGDPRFADARAGNFALLPGSPAMDAGSAWNVPTHDIAGRMRPWDGNRDGLIGYDLGAYEYSGSGGLRITRWDQRDQLIFSRGKLPIVMPKATPAPNPNLADSNGNGILDILENVLGALFGN